MLTITFSRRLAVAGGILLPVLETARRWRDWPGPVSTWIPWIDDYILGAILLIAAWLSRPSRANSAAPTTFRRLSYLTAGWAFVCGCGFGSTLSQLQYALNPGLNDYHDPSGLPHIWVTLAKAALVAIGLVGLFASMRNEPAPTPP